MYNIPLLTANDVECRVQSVTDKGMAILLLYKDARVDMKVLDQVFGTMNWQRKHDVVNGNLFCTVSVWDKEKEQWISKQDVGTESQTEAEKGQASDSFKRACFNLGIGRELYNSPFICVQLDSSEISKNKAGKNTTYTKFKVKSMSYDKDKEVFTDLVIVDSKGKERYSLGKKQVEKPVETPTPADEKWVGNKDGKTMVKSKKGQWCELEALNLDQLNAIINEKKYKECHAEARRLMATKALC